MEQNTGMDRTFFGRVFCINALVFCVPVGIVLGVVGYALGARTLGSLTVVLCTIAMFLGLLVGQGAMPGPYDAALDGAKEMLQRPFFNPGGG